MFLARTAAAHCSMLVPIAATSTAMASATAALMAAMRANARAKASRAVSSSSTPSLAVTVTAEMDIAIPMNRPKTFPLSGVCRRRRASNFQEGPLTTSKMMRVSVCAAVAVASLLTVGAAQAQTVSFIARRDLFTDRYPFSVAVGDFNGDGVPDLAVANFFSDTVSVFLGFGDGNFKMALSFAVGSHPHSVAVGDFNSDGVPDLAVATWYGYVSVLINDTRR